MKKETANGKQDRRTVNLKLRLTPEEMEHLRKCAEDNGEPSFRSGARINYSGYYRKHLLAETNYKNEELKRIQKRLVYEIRKIGVNINQVTKKINAGYGTHADLRDLKDELGEVEKLLKKTMEECEKLWESQS